MIYLFVFLAGLLVGFAIASVFWIQMARYNETQTKKERGEMGIIKKLPFSIWLGVSLALVGYPLSTWQFWFVMVPTTVLEYFFTIK